ncbi:MAG: glutamine synthetase, partial [Vulcanimicrobiota bacterium]
MFSSFSECISFIRENNIEVLDFKLIDLWGRWRQVSAPARDLTHKDLSEGFGFDASNYGFVTVEKSDMVVVSDPTTAFLEEWEGMKVLSFICEV